MRKIAIIILFLSFSCTKIYKEVTESKHILNVHNSQPFFGDFIYENKIDFYSDTMGIYLKHFNFSNNKKLESLLTNIYSRDQQYRDSLQLYRISLQSDKDLNEQRISYYVKQFILSDQLNKEIVKHIISIVGWPDTRGMNSKAHDAFWLTIFHSHDIKFITKATMHIEKALNDSTILPHYFASLMDKIYVRCGQKQIYGTYPSFDKKGNKIIIPQISVSVDSINVQRELIGLERIELP